MKKIVGILSLFIFIFVLAACGGQQKEKSFHFGINAIITEIDVTNKVITVKDSDEEGILGDNCDIDCSKVPMIYCNYDTGKVISLSFEDLQVNDEVLLGIKSSEIENLHSADGNTTKIKVEQIQLGTQRLDRKSVV